MKIGVISDTHDHMENLRKALDALKDCDALIHCGDLISPFVALELGKFKGKVYAVIGNNPGDVCTTMKMLPENVEITHSLIEVEVGGKKLAVVHYPEFADPLVATGNYDAVFYGHTHKRDKRQVNNTWVVNPGDLMGLHGEMGYAIYDTETNEVTMHDL